MTERRSLTTTTAELEQPAPEGHNSWPAYWRRGCRGGQSRRLMRGSVSSWLSYGISSRTANGMTCALSRFSSDRRGFAGQE